MIRNATTYQLFAPDLEAPTEEQVLDRFARINLLPTPWMEAIDVSNALLFLGSDEARYITGLEMKVDAGTSYRRRCHQSDREDCRCMKRRW